MMAAAWVVVILLFAIGMAGAVYPVLPGVIAIYAAFLLFGWMVSFDEFGVWFWIIQTTLLAVIFVADYAIGAWGVKRFGGSRASIIGSTIGVIIGPFVIPVFGLLVGPFIGAVIGERIAGGNFRMAGKAGLGALVGLFSGTVMKIALQGIMIVVFFVWVL